MASRKDVLHAKKVASSRLLRRSKVLEARGTRFARALEEPGHGLHAVGIGRKVTEGRATGTLCVRLYVLRKLAASSLARSARLPKSIGGVPTDVVEAPVAVFHAAACSVNRRGRRPPVVGGISAAHRSAPKAATFGCFCRSVRSSEREGLFMLGCNHSFANMNGPLRNGVLLQPSASDGGTSPADAVGMLARYQPIQWGLGGSNLVDAAIAVAAPDLALNNVVCSIGALTGSRRAKLDMVVCKHGRTTGYTEGRVADDSMDAYVVTYTSELVAVFVDQIRIDPIPGRGYRAPPDESAFSGWFAAPGDSGSVIVEKGTRKAVGLHFAGQFGVSVSNHMGEVCRLLRITIP